MSPDIDNDPWFDKVETLDEAKMLLMKIALGIWHCRVSINGEPVRWRFYDALSKEKRRSLTNVETALRMIRREVLNKNISVHFSPWGGHVVLYKEVSPGHYSPLPAESFENHQFQEFVLRVLELCSAWEGNDQHLAS